MRFDPLCVGVTAGEFARRSQPAFRRTLEVSLKYVGSDFHTMPSYSLPQHDASHSPRLTRFRMNGLLSPVQSQAQSQGAQSQGSQGGQGSQGSRGHTLISDLIFSSRLFISSSLDIFDFIIVTRRLMEE